MRHINSPMQVIDAAEGRGLVEVTAHKARATLSLVEPRLEAEKGAQYNLRELQALLHEADMTATATTIRYVYLLSFRKKCVIFTVCLLLYQERRFECWLDIENLL